MRGQIRDLVSDRGPDSFALKERKNTNTRTTTHVCYLFYFRYCYLFYFFRNMFAMGHSMSGDPELYIWTWANSMKFHKQRNLIIWISKHFEFFKSDRYSQSYGWLKFAAFPFHFCVYFLWIQCSDIKTLVSFLSVTIFSRTFVKMCQKICLLKRNHWHFPYDLWTYVNHGQVRHSFCVLSCMTIFQLLITQNGQLVWSWFLFYLKATE